MEILKCWIGSRLPASSDFGPPEIGEGRSDQNLDVLNRKQAAWEMTSDSRTGSVKVETWLFRSRSRRIVYISPTCCDLNQVIDLAELVVFSRPRFIVMLNFLCTQLFDYRTPSNDAVLPQLRVGERVI